MNRIVHDILKHHIEANGAVYLANALVHEATIKNIQQPDEILSFYCWVIFDEGNGSKRTQDEERRKFE